MPKPRRSGLPLSLALLLSPWPMVFWMLGHQETFFPLHYYDGRYPNLRPWVGWPLVVIVCLSAINLFARRPTKDEIWMWILWLTIYGIAVFGFVYGGLFGRVEA